MFHVHVYTHYTEKPVSEWSCPFNNRQTLGYKMEQKPYFFLSDWQMSTEFKNIGLLSLLAFRNYIICHN